MKMLNLLRCMLAACVLAYATVGSALGQEAFPSRTIHIIAPVPPASVLDISARRIAEILAEKHGWTIVVENVIGAGGEVGAQRCALAPKDAYTLCVLHTGALVTAPINRVTRGEGLLYKPSSFDLLAGDAKHTHALVVRAKLGSSLADVIKYAREHGPIKIGYTFQNGNTGAHLLASVLNVNKPGTEKKNMGIPLMSSKGGGDAGLMLELLSPNEDMDAAFVNISVIRPHMGKDQIRVVGVLGLKRSVFMPDVPTLHEQAGGEAYGKVIGWSAYSVPAGTPKDREEILTKALLEAMKDPRFVKGLENAWVEPYPRTPEAVRTELDGDIAWYQSYKESPASR
ncbi:tripartite tricarboxylate transporter substrate binding protein [Candidatus Kaiserbacteria bacterium]|nr:tripartite tricarboxylate transporter substrate binding protein [Candidatus Kaiserbacteria bacterium]